jgi:hypothetical protein
MAAAPDDDARRTLAELEAKLRELERELLRGRDAEPEAAGAEAEPSAAAPEPEPPAAAPEPVAAEPPPAEPEPEPLPTLDLHALEDARELLDDLRETIDELGAAAGRIAQEARGVVRDHGRTLARLELAARAAAHAEQAAVQAGRIAGTVVVEVGSVADPRALIALRDAIAAQPDAHDAYVRGVEDGRAVIEVHLAPPPTA